MAFISGLMRPRQPSKFRPDPVYRPGDLARQVFNPGNRGQDARYDISGLGRQGAYYTDGTYLYDDNGLSTNRPNSYVEGLQGADNMNGWTPGMPMPASSGGGGAGGSFSPNLGTYGYDTARAKLAYDRAVARKNEGVQRLNKSMGFQRVDNKTQIDPYNQYGGLQMLLGRQGGQLDDAWNAAADRGVGHKGLGAQGETSLRFNHGAQVADLGSQYEQAYQRFLQEEADALAEYQLAQQMAMYEAMQSGGYDYGYSDEGGGDDSGGGDDFSWLAQYPDSDLGELGRIVNNPRFGQVSSNARALAQSRRKPAKRKPPKQSGGRRGGV